MRRTDTYRFDVAVAMTVLLLGQLFLGRFVEYQASWRRLAKSLLGVMIVVVTRAWAGPSRMYLLLGAIVAAVLNVHGWLLPRRGINGWIAEPRDHSFALTDFDRIGKRVDREAR